MRYLGNYVVILPRTRSAPLHENSIYFSISSLLKSRTVLITGQWTQSQISLSGGKYTYSLELVWSPVMLSITYIINSFSTQLLFEKLSRLKWKQFGSFSYMAENWNQVSFKFSCGYVFSLAQKSVVSLLRMFRFNWYILIKTMPYKDAIHVKYHDAVRQTKCVGMKTNGYFSFWF
jgi:hypothetical protein